MDKEKSHSPYLIRNQISQNYANEQDQIKEIPNESDYKDQSEFNLNRSDNKIKENIQANTNSNKNHINRQQYRSQNEKQNWTNYNNKNQINNAFSKIPNTNNFLGNTDINNKRFEINPNENKRHLVSDLTKKNPNSNNTSNNLKTEKYGFKKQSKGKSINVYLNKIS